MSAKPSPRFSPISPVPCEHCPVRPNALFKPLSPGVLAAKQNCRLGQFEIPARQSLYVEGECVDAAYTVYSGWVAQIKHSPDGDRQILRIALPGDLLGHGLAAGQVVDHSAVTLSTSVVCAFSVREIDSMLMDLPQLGLRMLEMRDALVREYHARLASMGQQNAMQRIAFLLVEILDRLARRGNLAHDALEIPLSQADIADAVGITTVHACRVLKSMRAQGWIRYTRHRLTPVDPAGLRDLARSAGCVPC